MAAIIVSLHPSLQSDSLLLKHLEDDKNDVYAFEMAPVSSSAAVEVSQPSSSLEPTKPLKWEPPNRFDYMPLPTSEAAATSLDPWMPSSGLTALPSSLPAGNLDQFGSEHFTDVTNGAKARGEVHGSTDGAKAHGGKHSKDSSDSENEVLPAKMIKSEEDSRLPEGVDTLPEAMSCEASSAATSGGEAPPTAVTNEPQAAPQAIVMEWHSCSICLEEMVDSELLTHRDCGAIICPTCLQASTEHYSKDNGLLPCPVSIPSFPGSLLSEEPGDEDIVACVSLADAHSLPSFLDSDLLCQGETI